MIIMLEFWDYIFWGQNVIYNTKFYFKVCLRVADRYKSITATINLYFSNLKSVVKLGGELVNLSRHYLDIFKLFCF